MLIVKEVSANDIPQEKQLDMFCCKQKMKEVYTQQMLDTNADGSSWVCLKCGYYITLANGQLDEEVLDELKDEEEEEEEVRCDDCNNKPCSCDSDYEAYKERQMED